MHACIVNAPHRDLLKALIEFAYEEQPCERLLPYISYFRPEATPPTDASGGCYTCDPDTWRTDTVPMIAEIELGNEVATTLGRAISRGRRGVSLPPAAAGRALGRTAEVSSHATRSLLAQPRGSPLATLAF